MKPETKVAIELVESRLRELHEQARRERETELRSKVLIDRLIFAASSRCPCGAGLAYDPLGEDASSPFKGPSYWDCSSIILGTAVASGQPGSVQHTDRLPFIFYEIKSEDQPSANGATTRPAKEAA